MKKKLLFADHDHEYMKELSYYFMEQVPQFELVLFTKEETLLQYLQGEEPRDVLVLDEQFVNDEIKSRSSGVTRVVLMTNQIPLEGFSGVKKYQKLSDLVSQVLMHYAEEHQL